MQQIGIDWTQDVSLPIAGKSQQARHASATGAQKAVETRGAVALAYRRLLIECGPQSDYEAAKVLGRLVSSMCSTRSNWGAHVVPSGEYEETPFNTKRTRWKWVE